MGQLGPVSSLGFWGLFLVLGVSSLTLLIRPGILMFPVPIAFRAEAFMSDPEPTGRSKRARGIWQLPDLMRAAKADGHRGRKWSQPWGECEPLAQLAVTFPELWNICQPLPTPVPVTWLPLSLDPSSPLVKLSMRGLWSLRAPIWKMMPSSTL